MTLLRETRLRDFQTFPGPLLLLHSASKRDALLKHALSQCWQYCTGTFHCGKNFKIVQKYNGILVELVSKELNHLAAILHVYAGGF